MRIDFLSETVKTNPDDAALVQEFPCGTALYGLPAFPTMYCIGFAVFTTDPDEQRATHMLCSPVNPVEYPRYAAMLPQTPIALEIARKHRRTN